MIRAIIFDADGPLYVPDETVSVLREAVLRGYGFRGDMRTFDTAYEQEKFKAYVGAETIPQMLQTVLRSQGVSLNDDQAFELSEEFIAAISRITPTSEAPPVLNQLKGRQYATCVLADSFFTAVEIWNLLRRLQIDKAIDQVISSVDTRHLKNAPEAFMACLNALHVSAQETLFVGHQSYEMAGARAAQIRSVALTPISPPDITADYRINSLSELPALIAQIPDIPIPTQAPAPAAA